jgi:hypothetical protein
MNQIFYKGVLKSQLKENFIPGTVTNNFNIALTWKERISGNKRKGAASHVTHGRSCVIEILYNGDLAPCDAFQAAGVPEHKRPNCWLSAAKDKAQINTVCKYRILTDEEVNELFKL